MQALSTGSANGKGRSNETPTMSDENVAGGAGERSKFDLEGVSLTPHMGPRRSKVKLKPKSKPRSFLLKRLQNIVLVCTRRLFDLVDGRQMGE
jgi:hypothetical protein